MHPDLWLTIIGAILILAVIIRGLGWWYLPPIDLPGPANPVESADRHWAGESSSDEDWAGVLHIINEERHQNRPIAQLTHYEVEAVIRQLGVAEWVPERRRTAA